MKRFKILDPPFTKLTIVVIGLFLEVCFYTYFNLSFKIIIDDGLMKNNYHILVYVLSSLVIGWMIISVTAIGKDYLYAKCITAMLSSLYKKTFIQLHNLPTAYYTATPTGEILTHFSTDIASIETALVEMPALGLYQLFALFFNIFLMAFLNWKLTLISLFGWGLVIIAPKKIAPIIFSANKDRKKQESKLLSLSQENILMELVIKAFNLKIYQENLFNDIREKVKERVSRSIFLGFLLEKSSDIAVHFLIILTFCVGVILVDKKQLTIGSFVSFQTIFYTMLYSLTSIMTFIPRLMTATVGLERIEGFLNENPKIIDKSNAKEFSTAFFDNISFQNVSFGYQDSYLNLKNASFSISKGKSVAFVGASGSGKSTILNLMMRFYDPQQGKITLDGIDLQDITQSSLRQMIGYVSQEPLLFNTTIRENIRIGQLAATDEEIEAAAKLAEVHDIIMKLPKKYDTQLGERGAGLSGGQKQRITIARALVRKPPILIFDEATSALDPLTESAINNTIQNLSKNHTTLSVTHRLDSVLYADCIFVLENGAIREQGSHHELLTKNGIYKHLWDKQHGFIINEDKNQASITMERLKMIPLFEKISEKSLSEIIPLFHSQFYEKDTIIFKEGDIGDDFFIIVYGKVKIYKKEQATKSKDNIAILQDGDYFGEIALLKSVPRTAFVKTKAPTLCLTLRQKELIHLLEIEPELKIKLEKTILARGWRSQDLL